MGFTFSQRQAGFSNITTSHSTSSATFTTLTNPDQVTGLVLPANGLIAVWYQATWKESVQGAARAAIFLGAVQLEVATSQALAQSARMGAETVNTNQSLATFPGGLVSGVLSSGYTGDVTTGQAIGVLSTDTTDFNMVVGGNPFAINPIMGPCHMFAAAGTYTVSVQFAATSGSVTVQNRKLWARVETFG